MRERSPLEISGGGGVSKTKRTDTPAAFRRRVSPRTGRKIFVGQWPELWAPARYVWSLIRQHEALGPRLCLESRWLYVLWILLAFVLMLLKRVQTSDRKAQPAFVSTGNQVTVPGSLVQKKTRSLATSASWHLYTLLSCANRRSAGRGKAIAGALIANASAHLERSHVSAAATSASTPVEIVGSMIGANSGE